MGAGALETVGLLLLLLLLLLCTIGSKDPEGKKVQKSKTK